MLTHQQLFYSLTAGNSWDLHEKLSLARKKMGSAVKSSDNFSMLETLSRLHELSVPFEEYGVDDDGYSMSLAGEEEQEFGTKVSHTRKKRNFAIQSVTKYLS